MSLTNIPGTNPATDAAWDPLGGAPDPYVQMFAGTTAEVLSPAVSDTFDATWNFSVDIVLAQSSPTFDFLCWDLDTAVDDDDYMDIGATGTPQQWLLVVKQPGSSHTITHSTGMAFTMTVEPL